ncbi:hypothetical protein [Mesorhizobium sp. CO1-1-9]|uniref:hypothetical protein n=1 Tax=Mesorhizobium sp. CO1-1-9 TaxID=2876630 RepID=UPI001CC90B9B|nr:hypothetical protein [Mesorhizobium sp. CO1-1-9]MBZ9694913.1 hypothetical protein [Mesorhizobium sp. CO1-1-9]
MNEPIERPLLLRANAWDGTKPLSQQLPPQSKWELRANAFRAAQWLAPPELDEREWRNPDVGWGLVVPENDALGAIEKARGDDLPEPLRTLLVDRPGSPVLRFRTDLGVGYLRRYYEDGTVQDLSAQGLTPGTGKGRIPRYLLIYASPARIPWAVQYALNMSCCVGRLDLDGDDLANYVAALIHGFEEVNAAAPLIWSVDHGAPDITWLMARAIGRKLYESYASDKDLNKRIWLRDADATLGQLTSAIEEHKPALIVTTSHGLTGPLNDPPSLRATLGSLVDVDHMPLTSNAPGLNAAAGAIWYSHACCSAGSDAETRYSGLLPVGGDVATMLTGVAAAAGATIAPLPRALLGRKRPIRAFVGHVEPTFDWTLRDPQNGQVVTHALITCLWNEIYRSGVRTPIGLALSRIYREAGSFLGGWRTAMENVNKAVPHARDWALYCQLVAMDRQALVILGDPTVALPPFAG